MTVFYLCSYIPSTHNHHSRRNRGPFYSCRAPYAAVQRNPDVSYLACVSILLFNLIFTAHHYEVCLFTASVVAKAALSFITLLPNQLTNINISSFCSPDPTPHSDFSQLLSTLGLYFQIRDDFANLQSDEVGIEDSYWFLHFIFLSSVSFSLSLLPRLGYYLYPFLVGNIYLSLFLISWLPSTLPLTNSSLMIYTVHLQQKLLRGHHRREVLLPLDSQHHEVSRSLLHAYIIARVNNRTL